MLHKDWSLSPDTIKARLMRSATKSFPSYSVATEPATGTFTTQYDIFSVGAGYLDITAALNDSESVDSGSTAASPPAVFDTTSNTVRVVNTEYGYLGQSCHLGKCGDLGECGGLGIDYFVDGQAAMWGSSALWGSAAMWGQARCKATPPSGAVQRYGARARCQRAKH